MAFDPTPWAYGHGVAAFRCAVTRAFAMPGSIVLWHGSIEPDASGTAGKSRRRSCLERGQRSLSFQRVPTSSGGRVICVVDLRICWRQTGQQPAKYIDLQHAAPHRQKCSEILAGFDLFRTTKGWTKNPQAAGAPTSLARRYSAHMCRFTPVGPQSKETHRVSFEVLRLNLITALKPSFRTVSA